MTCDLWGTDQDVRPYRIYPPAHEGLPTVVEMGAAGHHRTSEAIDKLVTR